MRRAAIGEATIISSTFHTSWQKSLEAALTMMELTGYPDVREAFYPPADEPEVYNPHDPNRISIRMLNEEGMIWTRNAKGRLVRVVPCPLVGSEPEGTGTAQDPIVL